MQTHTTCHHHFPDRPQPPVLPSASGPPDFDDEEATEELLRRYEAEQRMMEDGETGFGCDWPDGPMSPSGCFW